MANDIDLGKISITPRGDWNNKTEVEYNDIWRYKNAKYLALQDSTGVVPADDGVYWYELSSQGKSAYQQAVDNGFPGNEEEWLQSLKQPALDGAARADAAVANMDKRFPDEISKIQSSLYNQLSSDLNDKVVKPLVISGTEQLAGQYKMNGEVIDIYERSVSLSNLPKAAGETKDYVIADEPLGFGTYVNVESFVASTGKGLNKEFFNFNYDITRFYINSQLQTCVVLKCRNTVSEEVNGLMHIQYCKFRGDVVEFDITLPSSVNREAISLEIPPLKYNKKMVFSYITDDSYAIYQYIFSLINKRYIAKRFKLPDDRILTWHLGMQGDPQIEQYVSDAYYPEKPAQCTDGAGIKKRYATTVATWPDKLKNQYIGQDFGYFLPWMSEKEFKLFFDFGFMVAYHDLIGYDTATTDTQAKFDKCVEDSVALFKEYIGITPKLMVEPNGDHKYITFSRVNDNIQVITAQGGDPSIKKVYPFSPDFTLSKNNVTIQRLFAYGDDMVYDNDNPQYAQDLLDILSGFNATENKESIYRLIGSTHRGSHWESVFIKNLHRLYGDIGLDNLWFPTLDEFFEYWYMRENTLSVKTVTETGVHYRMYVPKGANFFFRDLSVLISGVPSLEGVSVTSGDNVYGTSFAMNDGRLLVNLDFNPLLLERVNKYVESFEADYNAEYAYDDAYYFVQMLKPGLKEPYLARINKWVSPPVLESFVINSGQEFTQDRNVILNITYSGQAPSHYMVSEDMSFTGASWIEYVEKPTFKLSSGFNAKTVYVKLKNAYGETGVLSAGITLLEPTLTLKGITIDNGAASAIQRNVNVTFDYLGYPTHYMVSENSSFAGASWVEFTENPIVQLSASYGNKILYAKLKNATTETVSRSAAIELIDAVTARLDSITVNNGDASTDSGIVSVKFETLNTITKYKIGQQADLSDCTDWIVWGGSTVQYDSKIVDGNLTVYAQVGNETTESSIKSDSIQVVQPVGLTSITLAEGKDSFAGYTVPVSFEISQGTPTHYRLAETSAGLASAAWEAWKDNIVYEFATSGAKTLYGQLKNEVSESSVGSDSVTLTESPVIILLANIPSAGNVDGVGFVQPINSGNAAVDLKDIQGNNVGTLTGRYIPYNKADYAAMGAKLSKDVLGGTGAPVYWQGVTLGAEVQYPNSMIWDGSTKNIVVPTRGNFTSYTAEIQSVVILKGLTPGNYKVRLLLSDKNSVPNTQPWNLYVQNAVQQVLASDLSTKVINNNSDWYTFDDVAVDSDGYLLVAQGYNNDPSAEPGYSRISPICIVEVTKLS